MISKLKQCIECKDFKQIWGKKLCKVCYFKKFPSKPIAKLSKRGQEKKAKKKVILDEIHLWEKGLWDKMKLPRRCKSCGCKISGDFSPFYFDHLKEKANFPQLAMEEWNILFTCQECHSKKNNGFPTEVHKTYIEQAEIMYKRLKELEMENKIKKETAIPEVIKHDLEEEFGELAEEDKIPKEDSIINIDLLEKEEDELED